MADGIAVHGVSELVLLATDPPSRRVSALRLSTRYLTPAAERFLTLLVAASTDHSRRG